MSRKSILMPGCDGIVRTRLRPLVLVFQARKHLMALYSLYFLSSHSQLPSEMSKIGNDIFKQ
jgi:hypothetical protein